MNSENEHRSLQSDEELVAARQSGVLALHVACAVAAGLTLLGLEPLAESYFTTGLRHTLAGARGLMAALPALWPYIVSYVFSRTRVAATRWSFYLFASVLLFGTIIGSLALVQLSEHEILPSRIALVTIAEALIFVIAAKVLGRRQPTTDHLTSHWSGRDRE